MVKKELSLTYRWFEEVWNNNNAEAIHDMLDENAVIHGLNLEANGIDPFKMFHQEFNENFKDIHVEIERVIAEGDFEAATCMASAVQRHSGRKVKFPGMVLVKIKNGKVVEAWNCFDFLSMYLQLGQKLV